MKSILQNLPCLLAALCCLAAGCAPATGGGNGSSSTTAAVPARQEPAPPAAPPPAPPEKITFDDLNCSMQADIVFREWMLTDRARELDGRRIQITGFILEDLKLRGIDEFVLLKNTECKFGPGGEADHLIMVKLRQGVETSFTTKPVQVVGTLRFVPVHGPDGNTWAIYEMEGESVTPLRR